MPKKISADQKAKARKLFEEGYTLVEIAKQFNVVKNTVSRWKINDEKVGLKWTRKKSTIKKTREVNNKQLKNLQKTTDIQEEEQRALKQGFYAKYLNPKAQEIYKTATEEKRTELINEAVNIKFANTLAAQGSIDFTDANLINADTNALGTLTRMIKDKSEIESYELDKKLKALDAELKELQLEREKRLKEGDLQTVYTGMPANMVAPVFSQAVFDIEDHKYKKYAFPGGRMSTKSSFASQVVVDLMEKNPEYNALVLRRYYSTINSSVFNQIKKSIDRLGLTDEYKFTTSPYEITKLSTGQKIYFRGADKESNIKGITPTTGYIAILWFEELDQFSGEEAIRSIRQSAQRGGETYYEFMTFNPPKSKTNWANVYIANNEGTDPSMKVYRSDYRDVPVKWLGQEAIDEALFLKEHNPLAYENEYLGVPNGSGASVLSHIETRRITDEEIENFDNIAQGVDWGYIHPSAFVRANYDPNRLEIVVFDECGGSKLSTDRFAQLIKERGVGANDLILCDSAEPKSIARFNDLGLRAAKVKKGAGSREYGFKWLDSQLKIVIDPRRTPNLYREALSLEYERDKNGELTESIPKINDDYMDALRYSMTRFMRKEYDPFK